jgi:iron complex transport system substrate-binding protein
VTGAPGATPAALRELPGWRELRAVREGRVVTVPVELLGRPGPDMGEAARVLRDALHPGVAR